MFLLPGKRKELPFIIFASFLVTFVSSRVLNYYYPGKYSLHLNGVHIHHYNYGIIIISLVGLYTLVFAPKNTELYKTAALFGFGLALTYDEFGMWLHLTDDYWMRTTFDAVGIICALFINYLYFGSFWRKVGSHLVTGGKRAARRASRLRRRRPLPGKGDLVAGADSHKELLGKNLP